MNIIYNDPKLVFQIHSGEPWLNGESKVAAYLRDRFGLDVVVSAGAQKDFEFCEILKNSQIHLFDPNPRAFAELVEKLKDSPNVFLNQLGLSNVKQSATYYYRGESIYNHDGFNETETIQLTTLADYWIEKNLFIIDLLKVDVEGLEYEVIDGAKEFLPSIPFIQFEYGERYPKAGKTLAMMFELLKGRFIYHVESDSLRHLAEPGEEHFRYSNYLASTIKL